MRIDDSILSAAEKLAFALRGLYASRGYLPYRMTKFEEYDLYADNKDFLVSDRVITFTDTTGKLMALKPDVTLSIVKNCKDEPEETRKIYYNETVYRVSDGSGMYGEIRQTGLECLGKINEDCLGEVISLAAESLRLISNQCVLCISDLDVTDAVMTHYGLTGEKRAAAYRALSERNTAGASEAVGLLLSVNGPVAEAAEALSLLPESSEVSRFRKVLASLAKTPYADFLSVDFSVTGDTNYYNGIIFRGFVRTVPNAVLSGGQYDRLMRKLDRRSSAVGFAVYLDEALRAGEKEAAGEDEWINIALPKGRLGEKIYGMFADVGYECPSILEPNRKLIFENPQCGVRYFWVKPSDVAIYVERGAADIGVAGKDILNEYSPDVFELLDLKKGMCRMAVAAPEGYTDDPSRPLRVATKFSNTAREFYLAKGRDIDIIHLNGSIEIAPILGLSDVIVDIVETGTTLRENHLAVIDELFPISARLVANKTAFKFKQKKIEKIVAGLSGIVEVTK